jgi:hypothetical protein
MYMNTSDDAALLDSGSPVKVFVRPASLGSSASIRLWDQWAKLETGR